jgi:CBS domain-containing protein
MNFIFSFEVVFMVGMVSVREVMTKDVKVVREDTSVQEVVATMIKFDISSVVVVQKDRPVGLITHKDILMRVLQPSLLPSVLTARQVMSSPVATIKEEASIEEAAKLMTTKRFKKLLVVQGDKLVGIITTTDLVREQPKLTAILDDLAKT